MNHVFLNEILHENVYMKQPERFIDPRFPNHVCRLTKALYGLRQAPRAWFEHLKDTLLKWGFHNGKNDVSFFYLWTAKLSIFVLIYVNDILLRCNDPACLQNFTQKLNSMFALKDLGPVY